MTIRALTSPATGFAVAVLLLALLVTGGAAAPRPEPTASGVEAGLASSPTIGPLADGEVVSRIARVPASASKRRALRVFSNGCRYSMRGIPQCGVLLGAAYGANSNPIFWERSMRHRLGVHRTYYSAYGVSEAVRTAEIDLRHQRLPWISFKVPYSWDEMAAGRGDVWARRLAHRLSRLDGPVWVAFHHEPEGDGDIRHWTAMQERLAPIVRSAAPNVAYTVILTGWNQFYGSKQYSLESLWPKDTKIDLVGFDVYNKYGVVRGGRMIGERTRFKHSYFTRFERFAETHDVAWGLAETGYTDRSARVEPRFVKHLYNGVRLHGGIAVTYFNTSVNSAAPWRLAGAKGAQFAATLRRTPTL
jgi:hypothetical protein